ncbi:transcriptional protein SWT1 isoform X5 [Saccopteryx bilineata]|uniref:transcriptional protein SWT1 isoform X5 n=1 Tax=Saccopteryx bilineata TaxID=59482 RepID=UPI00338ED26C
MPRGLDPRTGDPSGKGEMRAIDKRRKTSDRRQSAEKLKAGGSVSQSQPLPVPRGVTTPLHTAQKRTGGSATNELFKMSNKESCGNRTQSERKDTTLSPSFDEETTHNKTSGCYTSSACSVRCASSQKRKLKSDHVDILNCDIKRRQDLKRPHVDTDTPSKRLKVNSSSQGPGKLQEGSYSNDNQIISQSPSNGTKKDISKCVDFKVKDIKLTNVRCNLYHGIKNLSNPKIAKDVTPKAECQSHEKTWPRVLAHREKIKELKKERHNRPRDSYEKCGLEKCKRIQFSQDYNYNKIIKEPLESRRMKISFKIPVKSHDTHQKPVEKNVFLLESNKSRTKQKKKGHLENCQVSLNLMKHKSKHLPSDSTYKKNVHEWKGKYHHEHQESNDSGSSDNLTQSFEARCSVSYESIQDTDQEMQIVEELHAARMGKSVDLPLVPPPGDLASMEIDLVEDDLHSSAANTASDKKLLIVIDTNILMNHLKFVRILKITEIPGFDGLVLIIPWIVVQELDRMKAGKLLKYAQHKAVPAVHFINDSLKNQDRKLWGQSIQLASQKLYGLSDENNDDRVLKCCLQYQELFPSSLVILCTDDRNLRNKGLISGVKSLSKEELSAEFLNVSVYRTVCHQPCVSKQQLKEANNADFTSVKFLLQDSQSLLHAFSTRSNYDGILPQAFAQVNKLLQTFTEVKAKVNQNSSENTVGKKQEDTSPMKSNNQEITTLSGSHPPRPNKHQEIWSVLEAVWITIYQNSTDVFQRLGSNSALTFSKMASFEEAFIYLQKLMAAVKNIREGIQRILAPNSSYQDVETLYNILIKYEVNKTVNFTAQELYDCVSQTEYRERLTIGCRQLVEMDCAMQQCNASVYMEAKNRGWCEDMLNYVAPKSDL